MTGAHRPDRPTSGDLDRGSEAHRAARLAVTEAEAAFRSAKLRDYRDELSATVRSASPFLTALLQIEGLELDDVAARLSPPSRWPTWPRMSVRSDDDPHAFRHRFWKNRDGRRRRKGIFLPLACGGLADVHVVCHSLEVEARLGGAVILTRFGELRIAVPGTLPETLVAAAEGLPIDTLVEHPALSGQGWRVVNVSPSGAGVTIACVTGSVPYRPFFAG